MKSIVADGVRRFSHEGTRHFLPWNGVLQSMARNSLTDFDVLFTSSLSDLLNYYELTIAVTMNNLPSNECVQSMFPTQL